MFMQQQHRATTRQFQLATSLQDVVLIGTDKHFVNVITDESSYTAVAVRLVECAGRCDVIQTTRKSHKQ